MAEDNPMYNVTSQIAAKVSNDDLLFYPPSSPLERMANRPSNEIQSVENLIELSESRFSTPKPLRKPDTIFADKNSSSAPLHTDQATPASLQKELMQHDQTVFNDAPAISEMVPTYDLLVNPPSPLLKKLDNMSFEVHESVEEPQVIAESLISTPNRDSIVANDASKSVDLLQDNQALSSKSVNQFIDTCSTDSTKSLVLDAISERDIPMEQESECLSHRQILKKSSLDSHGINSSYSDVICSMPYCSVEKSSLDSQLHSSQQSLDLFASAEPELSKDDAKIEMKKQQPVVPTVQLPSEFVDTGSLNIGSNQSEYLYLKDDQAEIFSESLGDYVLFENSTTEQEPDISLAESASLITQSGLMLPSVMKETSEIPEMDIFADATTEESKDYIATSQDIFEPPKQNLEFKVEELDSQPQFDSPALCSTPDLIYENAAIRNVDMDISFKPADTKEESDIEISNVLVQETIMHIEGEDAQSQEYGIGKVGDTVPVTISTKDNTQNCKKSTEEINQECKMTDIVRVSPATWSDYDYDGFLNNQQLAQFSLPESSSLQFDTGFTTANSKVITVDRKTFHLANCLVNESLAGDGDFGGSFQLQTALTSRSNLNNVCRPIVLRNPGNCQILQPIRQEGKLAVTIGCRPNPIIPENSSTSIVNQNITFSIQTADEPSADCQDLLAAPMAYHGTGTSEDILVDDSNIQKQTQLPSILTADANSEQVIRRENDFQISARSAVAFPITSDESSWIKDAADLAPDTDTIMQPTAIDLNSGFRTAGKKPIAPPSGKALSRAMSMIAAVFDSTPNPSSGPLVAETPKKANYAVNPAESPISQAARYHDISRKAAVSFSTPKILSSASTPIARRNSLKSFISPLCTPLQRIFGKENIQRNSPFKVPSILTPDKAPPSLVVQTPAKKLPIVHFKLTSDIFENFIDHEYHYPESLHGALGITSMNSADWEFKLINSVLNHEIARKTLLECGALSSILTEVWVKNHYRWIVWKCASMARRFQKYQYMWNSEYVYDQLLKRYDIEVEQVRRSCLKLIFEQDDVPGKHMILCVSGLTCQGN